MGNRPDLVNATLVHDNAVLVLDTSFRVLTRHVVADVWTQDPGFTAHLADADGDKLPEIFSLGKEALIFKFSQPR